MGYLWTGWYGGNVVATKGAHDKNKKNKKDTLAVGSTKRGDSRIWPLWCKSNQSKPSSKMLPKHSRRALDRSWEFVNTGMVALMDKIRRTSSKCSPRIWFFGTSYKSLRRNCATRLLIWIETLFPFIIFPWPALPRFNLKVRCSTSAIGAAFSPKKLIHCHSNFGRMRYLRSSNTLLYFNVTCTSYL